MFIILARKALLAVTSLMFRSNPSFQLAAALLVSFYGYVLQVAYRPYLCTGEKQVVLEEHKRKATEGSRLHSKIDISLRNVTKVVAQKGATTKTKLGWVDPGSRPEETAVLSGIAGFLVNYNTVEAFLLGCAVLVNLSGLMFQSGQFAEGATQGDRLVVTICVIFILVISVVYYCLVLTVDILATLKPRLLRRIVAKFQRQKNPLTAPEAVHRDLKRRQSKFSITNPLAGVLLL